ncbi:MULTISPECIES: serine/threonine-protein kinase [unclassified Streptosporangium]|uniref:serine/threonine-protein kinase n=1 Tax=unclassified Streptosporangium TaxID=2632669 RepID=UPI002E2C97FF|nr:MULTISPECIES: serine/threonine-protein kinase [unclassified Streptosporangium]
MTDRLLGRNPQGPEGGDSAGGTPEGQGRLVGRRYRLVSPVGRGGMGMVWHAHDVLLDRDVAVKELILPYGLDHAGKQGAHRRMLREARSAARLSHPGIVTVHDVVEEDGRPWIVMELVRAWSLEQAVRQSGPLPVVQAAEIGVRVLDALRHAHAAGIMHRDVKPGNVLLTSDRVVLTDFGIAAIEGDVAITQTGLMMGSPAYIPPERLSGQPVTQSSDLWSFGATLYAAVEGRPPYEGPDAVAVLGAILTQEPSRPQRAGALITVIEGLLRKNPADRMSASQVSDLLDRVLRSHGSSTPNRAPSPSPSSMPVPGDSMPIHLMPPLDVPSGPMPSRIIETPSGPIRVPYTNDSSGGHPLPYDALSSPSGSHRADLLSFPATGTGGFPQAGGPQFDAITGLTGEHRRGYDALRIPATGPDGNPFDPLTSFSGDLPAAPPSAPPAAPRRGQSEASKAREAALWPTPTSREASSRAAVRDSQSMTSPSRNGARGNARRAQGNGGGGPDVRLLMLGGGGVLAIVVAGLLVFLPGGNSDTPVSTIPSTPASTAAEPVPPAAPSEEIPEGFKLANAAGVSGAVPGDWTVKESPGGAVTFSGPKSGGQSIVVVEVPVTDPVTALSGASKKGLDEYTEVGVTAVNYRTWKAADWEYTYVQPNGVPMHGLTRYVALNGRTAYQITFKVQDLDWEKNSDILETFFATFTSVG